MIHSIKPGSIIRPWNLLNFTGNLTAHHVNMYIVHHDYACVVLFGERSSVEDAVVQLHVHTELVMSRQ